MGAKILGLAEACPKKALWPGENTAGVDEKKMAGSAVTPNPGDTEAKAAVVLVVVAGRGVVEVAFCSLKSEFLSFCLNELLCPNPLGLNLLLGDCSVVWMASVVEVRSSSVSDLPDVVLVFAGCSSTSSTTIDSVSSGAGVVDRLPPRTRNLLLLRDRVGFCTSAETSCFWTSGLSELFCLCLLTTLALDLILELGGLVAAFVVTSCFGASVTVAGNLALALNLALLLDLETGLSSWTTARRCLVVGN